MLPIIDSRKNLVVYGNFLEFCQLGHFFSSGVGYEERERERERDREEKLL